MTSPTRDRGAVDPLAAAQPQSTALAAPAYPRLAGLDVARGIALLGMIAVHALYATDAIGHPSWSSMAFTGRAAAAFAVFAGISLAFMTGRRRVPFSAGRPAVAALATRALSIGAIGLALGYTDAAYGAVILAPYAVMFLLAIPLMFLPTRTLAITGVVIAAAMPALSHLVRPDLPGPSLDNPSFADLLAAPGSVLTELSITGEYPALPWMAYLCAGMVVGRLNLARTRVAVALLGTGAVLAVAARVASSVLMKHGGLEQIWTAQLGSDLTAGETADFLLLGGDGNTPTSTWWWLAIDAPHSSTPLDLLGTTGTAVALLGAMLLASRLARPALRRLTAVVWAPLAAAGSMTLTLYVAHIAFINSDYDIYDANTGFFVQVAGVLLIASVWRALLARGPLETLVAGLTARARRWASRPLPRRGASIEAEPTNTAPKNTAPANTAPTNTAPTNTAAA